MTPCSHSVRVQGSNSCWICSSSRAATNALEPSVVPDSFPRVFGSVLGKGAWFWGGKASCQGLGCGGNAMLASHLLPAHEAVAMRSLVLYRVRPDYFISHEMKNSWLSQRPGSVGFGKQDAGQQELDESVSSEGFLSSATGCEAGPGNLQWQHHGCPWQGQPGRSEVWAESHRDPGSFCGAAQLAQNRE